MTLAAQPQRADQNLDDEAYALMQSAVALIPQGKWEEAAAALKRSAVLHAQAGRTYDEARCLQLAATLYRSAGKPEAARSLAETAEAIAPSDPQLRVSIVAEQAETAFAGGRYEEAVSAWTAALNKARNAGLLPEGMNAVLRRRGTAYIKLGQLDEAANDFDEACRLLEISQGKETAGFVRIEQADLLWRNGYSDQTKRVLTALEGSLQNEPASPHLSSELLVLRARLARSSGQMQAAVEFASHARSDALRAVAPQSYFAASVELAEALQAQGDLEGAYGTLATAWATLSDAIGKDAARSWVEPCLMAYQLRWGERAFRQAKSDYEARRLNTVRGQG